MSFVDRTPTCPLEDQLAETERISKVAAVAASDLLKVCKEVMRAAGSGDLGRLHKAFDRLSTASHVAAQSVANLTSSWRMTADAEEELLRSTYEDELIAAGARDSCDIRRIEGRLVSFPTVLRVVPGQRALQFNRTRMTSLRPSVVVAALKTAASRKPRQTPDRFIEVLYNAYQLVTGADNPTGTTLNAIHEALTLMPEVRRDYGPAEFARDIYELDRSGVSHTKSGARLSFPASTGTKGGGKVFGFITPTGEPVTYYGIRFT